VNVEVVGTCNLRCPSCAVGNYGAARKAGSIGGTMDPERFGAIIDRLAADFVGREADVFIALYSWGEPLLHPRIGDLIARARAAGFRVGLSSNLNFARYLDDSVQAGPDEFVVSLSGFEQAQYGISHSGGDIERVKANMRHLADLVALHGHRTEVFVHYHCYRHNTHEDVVAMAQLCESLRFVFLPGIAYYMLVCPTSAPPRQKGVIEQRRISGSS
jgi:MoaA/NifB/PqqE/SkfB family radical SAM enzyme